MGQLPAQPKPDYIQHDTARCKGCHAIITWWETPAGKLAPYDHDGTSHFATCPKAADFRRHADYVPRGTSGKEPTR